MTVWVTPDHRFLIPFSPSPQAERGQGGEVGAAVHPTLLPPSPLAGRGPQKTPHSKLGGYSATLTKLGRQLRSDGTSAERTLWDSLRGRRLSGAKFRRQHPLGPNYIVDFYCAEARLAIELDGSVHESPAAEWADGIRHRQLQLAGVRVLRFRNERVFDDLAHVLQEISEHISGTPESTSQTKEWWRAAGQLRTGDTLVLDGEGLVGTIQSIEYLFAREVVYDLTVDEDHSFLTAAGVVHNCDS